MNEIEAMANAGVEGAKAGKAGFDLIGKVFGPTITRRQAAADAQAEIQGALASRIVTYIESNSLDSDILEILMICGGKTNLVNLAKIVQKAESQLTEEATPSLITSDWAANFRDKARTCSDDEMADLWASLLASEANNPGSYSRKSVNILADLDKSDAELFSTLCRFRLLEVRHLAIAFPGASPFPRSRFNTPANPPRLAILEERHPIYSELGIDSESLMHLEGLGLITLLPQGHTIVSNKIVYVCENKHLILSSDGPIQMGIVCFTTAGSQISQLCVPLESPEGFADYLTAFWENQGVNVSNDLNKVITMTFSVGAD